MLLLLLVYRFGWSQNSIRGKIVDYYTQRPVAGVVIHGDPLTHRYLSDSTGYFILPSLPEGKYTLMFFHPDYYHTVLPEISLPADSTITLTVELIPGDARQFLYLSLGGILVTARDSLPDSEMGELMDITSGEMEHVQATNLGDVLDAVPGVVRVNKPGLWRPMQVGLRDVTRQQVDDRAELYGTGVVVDGIPLGNELNLNAGVGVGLGSKVQTTAGSGIDLRQIPADNLKQVKIITGVPSVEYGDVVGGMIQVQTRSGVEPLRLKLKNNPDTREVNLGGGRHLSANHILNLNLNYARSLRDLRIDGDEVTRLHVQARLDHRWPQKNLHMQEKISYVQFFEQYRVVGDVHATEASNRDFTLRYIHRLQGNWGAHTSFVLSGYLNYLRRHSFVSRYEQMEPIYVSDRLTDGAQVAVPLAGGYVWQVSTRGNELTAGIRFKSERHTQWVGTRHHWLLGGEFRYQENSGPGKQFNPLLPPYGATGNRPYPFHAVPPMRYLSYYLQDDMRFRWGFPWQLNLGIRADVYNPESWGGQTGLQGRNGSFWHPRLRCRVEPLRGVRLQVAYGSSSKLPPVKQLYPAPVYVDVMEKGVVGNDTLPLIHTHRLKVSNPRLSAFFQEKWETGVDVISRIGHLRLVLFRQKTRDIPVAVQLPYQRKVYFWPNWPLEKPRLVETSEVLEWDYRVYQNAAQTRRSGIEFLLKTAYLPKLNSIFSISGAYTHSQYASDWTGSVSAPVTLPDKRVVYPVYQRLPHWRKRFALNYRMDFLSRPIGLWFTITVYHVPYQADKLADYPESVQYASGIVENGEYHPISRQQAQNWQLQRNLDARLLETFRYPAQLLVNLVVSKRVFGDTEISFFVNNLLNDRGYYRDRYGFSRTANPEIFYGLEMSTILQKGE